MSTIEGPPLQWRDGGWHTTVEWETRINGSTITVPAGFRFDLASIPHLFRSLLDKEDLMVAGPLVHDVIYQNRGRVEHLTVPPMRVTRRAADRLFRQLMRAEGVSGWKRWVAWLMVRGFGWAPWPPSKTTWRNVLTRALWTLAQTVVAIGLSVWAGLPLWAVPPVAAGLSAVKTLTQSSFGPKVKGVLYR